MPTTHNRTGWILWVLLTILGVGSGLLATSAAAQAQCGPMDVVFVIDDTSSLQRSIDNIKAELNTILNDIQKASNNDYRLALVTFKDDVTVRVQFTTQNRDVIAAQILALTAEGGGRLPEASDEALNTVINALSASGRPQTGDFSPTFRDRAFKLIILLTDAVPGGFDDTYTPGVDDKNAHAFALQAGAKGIKISAIYVPTYPEDTAQIKPIMQDYATATAGFYLETASDGAGTATAIKTIIAGCGSTTTTPTLIPGLPSDSKAGSVLFYNFYTSDIARPNLENTQINITNVDENKSVLVHLFFVDSASCQVADLFLCIPPTRHFSLLASEYDPGVKGYVVAVAVNAAGVPIKFNALIGGEYVKLKTGHQAQLNAVSFAAIADDPAQLDEIEETATLLFDGVKYDFSPRVLALNNFASPVDGNSTLLIVNKFGGNLTKLAPVGTFANLPMVFYNDKEVAYTATLAGNACQTRNELRDGYPRVIPRFSLLITSGHTGWMRFNDAEGNSIIGAALTYNPTKPRNGGTNLHQVAVTDRASYVLPLTAPPFTCP
jgi:uncharacterized protein YegL